MVNLVAKILSHRTAGVMLAVAVLFWLSGFSYLAGVTTYLVLMGYMAAYCIPFALMPRQTIKALVRQYHIFKPFPIRGRIFFLDAVLVDVYNQYKENQKKEEIAKQDRIAKAITQVAQVFLASNMSHFMDWAMDRNMDEREPQNMRMMRRVKDLFDEKKPEKAVKLLRVVAYSDAGSIANHKDMLSNIKVDERVSHTSQSARNLLKQYDELRSQKT